MVKFKKIDSANKFIFWCAMGIMLFYAGIILLAS